VGTYHGGFKIEVLSVPGNVLRGGRENRLFINISNPVGWRATANIAVTVPSGDFSVIPDSFSLGVDAGSTAQTSTCIRSGYIMSEKPSTIVVRVYDTMGTLCDEETLTITVKPGLPWLHISSVSPTISPLEVGQRQSFTFDLYCQGWEAGPVRDIQAVMKVIGNAKVSVTPGDQYKTFPGGDFSNGFTFDFLAREEGMSHFTVELYVEGEKIESATFELQVIAPWLQRNLPSILGFGAVVVCLVIVAAYMARRPSKPPPPLMS
jgi:hypothetical protein